MQQINVPFFSLQKQTEKLTQKMVESFNHILKTQQFIGGPLVQEFEKKLAHFLGNNTHVISCNSGTDGLWLALKALDVQPKSIVLTTPFSFIASSSEILALEAYPVMIDIEPDTFNISPALIQAWLKEHATMEKGRAVHTATGMPVAGMVIVDLFGQCADYQAIKKIAQDWNLWIIEDACQAIGAHTNNQQAGTFGDIGVLSFYPTKNLGAFGDAGCCITSNQDLAMRLTKLKNHGRASHYAYEEFGINSRLDTIQASVLSIKLDELNSYNQRRREIAAFYNQALANVPFLQLPQEHVGHHVYHQYCVVLKNKQERAAFMQHLATNGVGSNIYYPQALTQIAFLNTRLDLINVCPVAEHASQAIVALPIWPELEQNELNHVVDVIKNFQSLMLVNPTQPTVEAHAA
ncbi:DegT/DnrJ/EryC1/StrS family aminotransferase [Candidatus Babeliales bacterium]|nr:DegT/DnrJ/EryC1/StrS family aminotransferase [Candidatus Babeliales bacterium]